MSQIILPDSTPLGILANPRNTPQTRFARAWLAGLAAAGHRVIVPAIADYEVRRELIRLSRPKSIARLDWLAATLEYLPLATPVVRLAADPWATARRAGVPPAHHHAPDGDVILAAQTLSLADPTAVIATGNPARLARVAPAHDWTALAP